MADKISLSQERLYRLFEAGAHFAHHCGGNFDKMDNTFINKLEELLAEQIEDNIKKMQEQALIQDTLLLSPELAERLKKQFKH